MDVSSLADDSSFDYSPSGSVLDNNSLAYLDLPGQFDSIPGGSVVSGAYPGGAADPSGINSLFLDSNTNPIPTGGYMTTLAQIANAAATGFSTYVKGSPSVATPPPRYPGSSLTKPMLTGTTNWLLVGVAVVAGLAVIAYLAHAA
jgi:hypothetical protein